MKRNYLYIVAILFIVTMSFVLVGTHALDERKKQPVFVPQRVERVLPKLPRLHR